MKEKISTDLKQSKNLAEFLPLESADMNYWCGTQIRIGGHRTMDKDLDVPSWSLAALLNYLREIDFFPEIEVDEHGVTMSISYYNEKEARPLAPVHNINVKADNFIDACYEVIIRLKELKLL